MQAGDTAQVLQQDGGQHWIYATVLTANADGSALVQISHPGNRDHGLLKSFAAAQIRTKADVQKLIDAGPQQAGNWSAEKRSLENQLDFLS